MQITHEQAQQLIQLDLDQALSSQEAAILFAHLRECMDCQVYVDEMKEVDRLLFPLLKRQWNRQPIPLSISALGERKQKIQASYLLTTRKAAIALVVVALFFSAWQFALMGPSSSSQLPVLAPPVPTPSVQRAQSTNTMITFENCKTKLYVVQGGDTLAAIASQFSVSKEEIMELNQLKAEDINPSMQLIIPLCTSTPTGTVHPVTFTTTDTPIIKLITSTPGG